MNKHKDFDTKFIEAIKAGDLPTVRRLVESGADPNAPGEHGLSPLHFAQEDEALTRFLVSVGADLNYTGFREGSILMLAAYSGELDKIALYLELGADVNVAMPDGGETPLHMAAVTGRTEAAKALLQAGAEPNRHVGSDKQSDMFNGGAKLWGETPLHYAAAYGDTEMIEAMLTAGADKNLTNALGEKPLAYAGRHNRPREIRSLLS